MEDILVLGNLLLLFNILYHPWFIFIKAVDAMLIQVYILNLFGKLGKADRCTRIYYHNNYLPRTGEAESSAEGTSLNFKIYFRKKVYIKKS